MKEKRSTPTYPGLSELARKVVLQERDRRKSMGLKSSMAAILSEAVMKVFGSR